MRVHSVTITFLSLALSLGNLVSALGIRADYESGNKKSTCTKQQAKRIDAWIDQSIFLFQRGGAVLDEIWTQHKQSVKIPPPYTDTFSKLLGRPGSGDVPASLDEFRQTFIRLGSELRTADILIRCAYDLKSATEEWPWIQKKGEVAKKEEKYFSELPLKRIGISRPDQGLLLMIKSQPTLFTRTGEDYAFRIMLGDGPAPDKKTYANKHAVTLAGTHEKVSSWQTEILDWDLKDKGESRAPKKWSDIYLLPSFWELEKRSTPENWWPKFSQTWSLAKDVPSMFSTSGPPTFVHTFMHELLHTHIGGVYDHETVRATKEHANTLRNVLEIASDSTKNPAKNPETYVFLAVCMNMPWLKFWDPKRPDKNGRALFNGMRTESDGQETVWLPLPDAIATKDQMSLKTGGWFNLNNVAGKEAELKALTDELNKGPFAWAPKNIKT